MAFCAERAKSNSLETEPEGIITVDCVFAIVKEEKHTSNKHRRTKRIFQFFTVFIAGNWNVVDSSELETGAGEDLELDRT